MKRISSLRRSPNQRPLIEPLEARIAPAANNWIGVASGNWNTAGNWSDGVPTADDVVTINPAGTLTITIDSGAQVAASVSMPGDDVLSITGGSLTLTASSVLHNLTLTNSASLFANAAVSLTGSGSFGGTATLGGSAAVTVPLGATFAITSGDPNLQTELVDAGTVQHGNAYLDLDGAAAKLRVISGGLYETVTTGSGYSFRATNGTTGVFVESGAIFRQNTSNGADFSIGAGVPFAVNGGTVQATGASTSQLYLNGAGVFTNATLSPSAGKVITFGNDNTVVGALTGTGAGSVNLGSGQLHATAAGATLNFPAGMFNWGGTGSLSGPGIFTNNGTLQISDSTPKLQTELVDAGSIKHGNAYLDLDGAAAKLRVVSGGVYETVTTGSGYSFHAFNGTPGVFVEAGGIFRQATSNGADFSIGAGVPFSVLTGGTVQTAGVGTSQLNLNGAGTFTNAILSANAGTVISFGNDNTVTGTLSGSGAGAINLSSGKLHASAGGAVLNFPAGLFNWSGSGSLSGPGVFSNAGVLQISSGDPNLETELVNGGTIRHGNAYLDLDGAAAKLRTIAGGLYETVTTGSGYNFRVSGGAAGVVVEAGAIFRQATPNGADFSIGAGVPFAVTGGSVQTVGVGTSVLNLNGVGTLTNAILSPNVSTIINIAGIDNTVVGTLNGTGAGSVVLGSGQLHATAAGATLNFPAGLFNWNGSGSLSGPGVFTNTGTIQITGGDPNLETELVNAGTIRHGNAYLDLDGAAAKLRTIGGGLYETVTTGSGYNFRVSGGAAGVVVEAGAIFRQATPNGADFSIGAGVPFAVTGGTVQATGASTAQLNLNGAGVFTNATLSPSSGKVINFGNENTVIGTLTGSGLGSVNLGSGQLHATAAGATLNFPAGIFNWGGSGSLSGPGIFTNSGTIQITSGDPNLLTELVNAGTIKHGNAYLDLDGATAKIRTISGGLYETVTTGSGYSFRVANGSPGVFVEAGAIFRHNTPNGADFSTGAGTAFSNLGKVEVARGALNFTTAPAQITGAANAATLAGGAWEVADGATLNLGITGLRTNAAYITVRGTGAVSGFAALATNSGALSLLAGADLTTAAAFTNSGSLTLSAGSVLTAPSFTQSAAGSVAFEIAGTTAAQLGRIATAGAATLGGTAHISVAASFSPAAAQNFPLMTFASRNGAFASVTGLNVGHANLFEVINAATSVSLNSLVNASNLAVETVSTPGPVAAGNDVSFSYTVRNTGAFVTPIGAWSDTVYLSKDGVPDASDIVLTRVAHSGTVGANGTYTANVTVPLVGALPADYQIIVVADALGRVADTDRANNTLASTGAFTLSIPTLTSGVAFNGTIVNGRDQYFQITLPAGLAPSFTFTGAVAGEAEIYESINAVPTRSAFFESAFVAGSMVQRIVGDTTAAATYYILVHGRENAGAGQAFSLVANGAGFDLTGTSVAGGANIGRVTTTLSGTQLSSATTFTLVSGGTTRAATATYFHNSRSADATFDLTGLAAGSYNIVANNGGPTDTLTNAFTVTNGGTPGTLKYSVSSPSSVRPQGGTVTISFQNVGQTDLDAPLFNLLAENARLRLAGETTFLGATFVLPSGQPLTVVELLGVSGGLAGILSPGERGSIEVSFQAINSAVGALAKFEAQPVGATNDPVDFSRLKDDLRPAGVRADAWDAVFTNFQAGIGGTTASYRHMLVENANYLGQFGAVSADVTRLVEFELEQAGGFGEIASRYALGELGRGNAAPFSLQATTEADGDIVLSDGLSARAFSALSGGAFAGTNLDGGKLTRGIGGELTLTEATGEKTVFRASDGRIDFVEDTNGNRITAARNAGGQLLTLTASATGDVTTFTHNAQGRIATVTDAVGRVTTYGYDAGGEHLTSIATTRGTASYTYTPAGHAIASVTGLNGLTTSFTYDARGRLATQTAGTGGNTLVTSVAYDDMGGITVTEPGARETHLFRTLGGTIARSIDPLGNVTSTAYDALGRIASVTDASGLTTKTSLDAKGLLAGFQSADRTKIGIDLGGDLLRLRSVTDQGGDLTRFAYDALGNRLSTTQPDGATDHFEYDTDGRVTAATDANGQRSTFTYNGDGLVTQRAFPDGTQIGYTYDAHRNLLTATDAEGTTTFTYDAADRRTSVAYPNGTGIAITYDAQGHRATVADQTGYTVRYSYDSLGRLDQVRDTANVLLVDYGYDALGQLANETRGNGSSTAYTYDGGGRVVTITHRDAASATTGSFAYTYDTHDRVQTVTTAAGTTTYTYDLTGQLTRVELPAGRTIAYTYDTEGNRTSVIDSAAGAENYAANNGDQYTTAGEETLTYDGAGNILTRTQGGVTTSYTYDSLGQLTGITAPGSVITFDYDALGNRIGKTENGARTDYANDPLGLGTLFGEYNGPASAHYASGLGIAARESAGSTAFYHYDAAGNTALVSGAAGAAVATYTYLPFGEIAAQTGTLAQPFTFNGQFGVQDDPGDLFHMRARAYDAELGRFTTHDPIGFIGGDANLYRFAGNDPVNLADPSGLDPSFFFPVPAGALAATSFYNGVLPGSALPAVYGGAPAPIGGTLVADTKLALDGYTGVSSSAGFSGELASLGTVAETGAAGIVGFGALAAAGGLVVGTLFDEITEFTNPGLKQAFRDSITKSLGYPDGSERTFGPDFVRQAGKNPYFTEIVRKGIKDGLSQENAILDAIRIIKKLGLENETAPGTPSKTESRVVRPSDPNNVIGPAGAGADPVPSVIAPGQFRFDGFVSGSANFGYKIEFENKPSATAPAQVVHVTQTLDGDLDLSTFAFTGFGFGANVVTANGTGFHTIYDATATLGVLVQIDADLNTLTGVLDVTYTSLDPATNDVPLDPFAGFLPPDDGTGKGDGFLTYSVSPKTGLANATVFTAIASIVFDTEAALATPTVTNKLDIVAPTSTVNALPTTTPRGTFLVSWTTADDTGGSGVSGTTILYTDTFNGVESALQTLVGRDAGTAARFDGVRGHTYKFFSQGIDNVGNTTALSAVHQTVTIAAPTFIKIKGSKTFTDADGDKYTITYSGPGKAKVALLDPDGDGKGAIDFLQVDGSTLASSLKITVVKKAGGDGLMTIGDATINGALASLTVKQSDFVENGITATGAIGTIKAHGFEDGFAVTTPGAITLLKARTFGDGTITAKSIGKLQANGGGFAADVTVQKAIGGITVNGGALSGALTAKTFGAVNVTGGDFSGALISRGVSGALALSSLAIAGGNLTGDVGLLGKSGAISVAALQGVGGNANGATVFAAKIAALVVGGDVTNSMFLAGADLGTDFAPGGADANADTFATGSIGAVKIGGNATGIVIGAGLDPMNAILHDAGDTIVGGTASKIASIIVKGSADAPSYFAAGKFGTPLKIAGASIVPASDPRFFVG